MKSLGGDAAVMYAKDIFIAWKLLIGSVGVAFVIAVIYLILLQLIGGAMIWLSFALALVGTGVGGVYAFMYSSKMRENNPADPTADYVLYGAYTAWGLCAVVLCIFCCCF